MDLLTIFKKRIFFPIAVLACLSACSKETAVDSADVDELGEYPDFSAAEYCEPNLYTFSDFVYLTECSGESYNSYDNPERFADGETMSAVGDLKATDYKQVSKGTRYGGLTLTEASVTYQQVKDKSYIVRQSAVFDGELTLKGYIGYNSGKTEEPYTLKGEITFIPCDGEWSGLPIIYGSGLGYWSEGDFQIETSAPVLRLGVIDDYDFDVSLIPSDSVACVEVSISDIKFNYSDGDFGTVKNTARLIEISGLE